RVIFGYCAFSLLGTGCSIIPDLPPERDMPVQEIMLHAVCELRAAFIDMSRDKRYVHFHVAEWSMNITLTPKVDTQLQAFMGYSGKSTVDKNALRLITWTLGTSPGLRADLEGHRDGTVTFPLTSAKLLDVKNYPLSQCKEYQRNAVALMQYLGVRE